MVVGSWKEAYRKWISMIKKASSHEEVLSYILPIVIPIFDANKKMNHFEKRKQWTGISSQ
jgi:hypothetical protein